MQPRVLCGALGGDRVPGVSHRLHFDRERVRGVRRVQSWAVCGQRVERGEPDFLRFSGFFTLILAFWQCTTCPAGSWGLLGLGNADNCTSCAAGKYSTGLGMTREWACTSCLGGTYSDKARAGQVSRRFLLENHRKWLFLDKIMDFIENCTRVPHGKLQIQQTELEKARQSASESPIREGVELGKVSHELWREGFVVSVPAFGVEPPGKLQNLGRDGLAVVGQRRGTVFLAAMVQLGVVLALTRGEKESERESKEESAVEARIVQGHAPRTQRASVG